MQTAEEMRAHLTSRAAEDADFRQQLIADPKGVISQELGVTIPDSMEIKVHESDIQTVHLALPVTGDMTEEQLEAISAGLSCCI